MPSIKEAMGADLSGYKPSSGPVSPVSPASVGVDRPKANPSLRCPLPPFNIDPDTLRQFETSGVPQIRVIPLPDAASATAAPARAVASASAATASNTTVTTASSTPAASQTATFSTGVILVGSSFMTSVAMAKAFQLLAITVDQLSEVRLYGTANSQAFDNVRPVDVPVAAEISSNIVTSVNFDTLPYTWGWQNRGGANQDSPQAVTIYVSVFNTDVVDVTNINVTITYVPLES
jgi:hypothetical protein